MTPFEPEILSVRGSHDQVELELRVQPELGCFKGHFPRHPILPGVVQLSWAEALGAEHLQSGAGLVRIEALKFSRIIRPDARLRLALEWSATRRSLTFLYSESGAPCSSGRFVFTS